MKKLKLLVMLLIFGQCTSFVLETALVTWTIIQTVQEIVENVEDARKIIEVVINVNDTETIQENHREIMDRFQEVSNQITQTDEHISQHVTKATDSIKSFTSQNVPLMLKYHEILDTMNRISLRYQEMQRYENYRESLEVSTLLTFAEWTVNPNPSAVPHLMDRLHMMLFTNSRGKFDLSSSDNVLSFLADNYEDSNAMCHAQQSTQQFLYTLYTDIALVELKGYTMMEFSWMILRNYGKGNFSREAELLRWNYGNRTEKAYNLLKKVMTRSSRIVWRCDPDDHIHGVTYDEVTRLLQGFFVNEENLNHMADCSSTCSNYTWLPESQNTNNKFYSGQPKCTGNISFCDYVDDDITVCQAPSGSSRRYDYIKRKYGRVLGLDKKCERGTDRLKNWYQFLRGNCDYCFCLCEEQGPKSDRYFNLRESIADVEENKVVTGLRFVKKNRVFHLQIQQGQLLPLGLINETTLEWKPVDDYKINDANIVNGVDYHTMNSWSHSVRLDNIMNTNNNSFLVTGVSFRAMFYHLYLKVRISKFDIKTGKLLQPEINSEWRYDHRLREKINLDNRDVPTSAHEKSLPISEQNKYISFVNTGVYQDAAQTTIPFIDIQDVVTYPPAPLSGIGIHYKTSEGYGGFIAPKIITYDISA